MSATPTIHAERAVAPAPEPRAAAGQRGWWALVLLGGLLGIVTSTWQTVERIAYAKDPTTASVCEINSVLSCSSVYDHWQSSALGIPNSLIGLSVFAILASAGLAGVLGSTLARGYLAFLFGLTVFMTGFVVWYMQQSAFSIRVLCLFCVGCAVNIVLAGVGITRVAAANQVFGSGRAGRELETWVRSGADVMAWVGIAVVIAAMLVIGLTF